MTHLPSASHWGRIIRCGHEALIPGPDAATRGRTERGDLAHRVVLLGEPAASFTELFPQHAAFLAKVERGRGSLGLTGFMWDIERPAAYNVRTREHRPLTLTEARAYAPACGAWDIPGTADLVSSGSTLVVADLKTGNGHTPAQYSDQLRVLALANGAREAPRVALRHYVITDTGEFLPPDDYVWPRAEIERYCNMLDAIAAEIYAGTRRAVTGYWCSSCPARTRCAAYATAPAVDGRENLQELARTSPSALYGQWRRTLALADDMEEALKTQGAPVRLDNGKTWGMNTERRRVLDIPKAMAAIDAVRGPGAGAEAAKLTLTIEAAKKAAGGRWPEVEEILKREDAIRYVEIQKYGLRAPKDVPVREE